MRAATTGSSANNATPTRRSSSNITQPAISDAPTHEGESESFGHENRQLDELAHYEGRRNHLEGQAEDVQYVGEQAGVIVLLEFHIHPFGRHVVAAVVTVGLPQADPEPLCLVPLGGGQQKQHRAVDTWLGAATAQVPRERKAVDIAGRADGVRFQPCEELLSACEPSIEKVGVAVAFLQISPVTVDT